MYIRKLGSSNKAEGPAVCVYMERVSRSLDGYSDPCNRIYRVSNFGVSSGSS